MSICSYVTVRAAPVCACVGWTKLVAEYIFGRLLLYSSPSSKGVQKIIIVMLLLPVLLFILFNIDELLCLI